MERWKTEGKGGGEWPKAWRVKYPRTRVIKQQPTREGHAPACLALSCPRPPPRRWEKGIKLGEKHLSKNDLRKKGFEHCQHSWGDGITLEEESCLALYDEMEKKQGAGWRKCQGGLDMGDGAGQREDDVGREVEGLISQSRWPFQPPSSTSWGVLCYTSLFGGKTSASEGWIMTEIHIKNHNEAISFHPVNRVNHIQAVTLTTQFI